MGYDTIDQPIAFGSNDIDGIAQEQELEGAAHAYYARQEITGPHIRACQAYLCEEESKARLFRGDAQVGGQRKHGPGTRRYTIESRDDGFIKQAHMLHDCPGHARKFEMRLHVPLEQLADDFMHITAGTEAIACSGDNDDTHRIIIAQQLK